MQLTFLKGPGEEWEGQRWWGRYCQGPVCHRWGRRGSGGAMRRYLHPRLYMHPSRLYIQFCTPR